MRLILPLLLLAPLTARGAEPWLRDLAAARAEAKRAEKPLLVVFRCDPCDDTADFDARVQKLDSPALQKCVKLKLTRITGVDLNRFDFDYDCTWYAFLLSADGRELGRFGGRDAAGADRYLKPPAFERWLHAAIGRTPPAVAEASARKAEDYPGFQAVRGNSCVHCHQLNVWGWELARRQPQWDVRLLERYPDPAVLGLHLDPERGDTLGDVPADSAAHAAGLRAGDRLMAVNGRAVASFGELSHAVHLAGERVPLKLQWQRDGRQLTGELTPPAGYRRTDHAWRPSLLEYLPRLPLSGEDLTGEQKQKLGIAPEGLAFRHDRFLNSTLKAAGLRDGDVITGLDGKPLTGTGKALQQRIKNRYFVGERLTLEVLRAGERARVEVELK